MQHLDLNTAHVILPSPLGHLPRIPGDAPCKRTDPLRLSPAQTGEAREVAVGAHEHGAGLYGERRKVGIRHQTAVGVGTTAQILEEAEVIASGIEQQRVWMTDQGADEGERLVVCIGRAKQPRMREDAHQPDEHLKGDPERLVSRVCGE